VITMDNIQQIDYLTYVIKEALRLDGPAVQTFPYIVNQDITVCNVKISKGTPVRPDIIAPHYSPNEWQKPKEFIPERYDPESKYYARPGKGSIKRDPSAWLPFSRGIRTCPGQSIAMLELKVLLAYFLTRVEYEVDKKLFETEGVGFANGSHFKLDIRVTKIIQ